MAETMLSQVGVFRSGDQLEQAVKELRDLERLLDRAVLRSQAPGMNPELTFALRLRGMVRLALMTALGALARTESRGAHYPHRSSPARRRPLAEPDAGPLAGRRAASPRSRTSRSDSSTCRPATAATGRATASP